MKHIKRISFLLAIMTLLLMSFALPASAAEAEATEPSKMLALGDDDIKQEAGDLGGGGTSSTDPTEATSPGVDWPADIRKVTVCFGNEEYPFPISFLPSTWDQMVSEDQSGMSYQFVRVGVRFIGLRCDYNQDGEAEIYRLSYIDSENGGKFRLVQALDQISTTERYLTDVEIRFVMGTSTNCTIYYPSYLSTWNDLITMPVYDHEYLGLCSWAVSNEKLVFTVTGEDGTTLTYYPTYDDGSYVGLDDSLYYNDSPGTDWVYMIPVSEDCTHNYVKEVTEEASCTTDGWYILTCSLCGDQRGYPLLALGHSFLLQETVKLNCPEVGYRLYACFRCGETKKSPLPVNHTYTTATCTEPSYCTGCNEVIINALGHDYNILGTCRCCDHNRVVEGWNNLWGSDDDSSGDGSGSDKNIFDQVEDKVGEFFGGIFGGDDGDGSAEDKNIFDSFKDWADGIKNDINSFFKTIMTVIFIVLLIALLSTLLPLIKAVFEGLTFAVKSVTSLFTDLSRSIKRKSKKRKRAYQR